MFSRTGPLTLFLLPLAIGCAPHVSVEVLQPAMVTFPAEIQTLAVIDRSAPSGVGEGVLGTLEGLVTGEMPLADREGAKRAVQQTYETLSTSPRFKVVNPGLTGEQADTGIWSEQIDWARAERICKKAGCDAIVALEAFDSDSSIDVSVSQRDTTDDKGLPITVTVNTAQRQTSVLSAWRVYDVKNHQIIDDLRDRNFTQSWSNEGETRALAIAGLPDDYASMRAMGDLAGDDYARRISPNYIWVSRSYYGRGHDRLKEAKNHVKADDWEGASKIWSQMVKNQDDPKVKGKASFNLAVWNEMQGDLETAHDLAKQAAIGLHNGRSRNYAAVLGQRLADQRLLEEQMKAPEPKPEEKPAGKTTTVHPPDASRSEAREEKEQAPATGTSRAEAREKK